MNHDDDDDAALRCPWVPLEGLLKVLLGLFCGCLGALWGLLGAVLEAPRSLLESVLGAWEG